LIKDNPNTNDPGTDPMDLTRINELNDLFNAMNNSKDPVDPGHLTLYGWKVLETIPAFSYS
jgi:hypothetical protein